MKQSRRLVLIDASGFIFRAFHALPGLTRPDGAPVGAVLGFLNMMLKTLERWDVDALGVVFDVARQTFRHTIFPAYKANRGEVPSDLAPQFHLVRQACHAFDWPVIESPGFEADDVIATYVDLATRAGLAVTLVSSDKDLAQLLPATDTPDVMLYDPLKNKELRHAQVLEKWGVLPQQFVDFQALMGDSSDNIPGVPGIGPKTAAALLKQFGSLDCLLSNLDRLTSARRRTLLKEHEEAARLSQNLVRLRRDAPIHVGLDDLMVRPYILKKIEAFLRENHFDQLLSRLKKAKNFHHVAQSENYVFIQDDAAFNYWFDQIPQYGSFAFSLDISNNTLGLALEPGAAAYFSLSQDREERLRQLFQEPGILKIGYDLKKDWTWLCSNHIFLKSFDDILLLAYVLEGRSQDHDLSALMDRFCAPPIVPATQMPAFQADCILKLHALFKKRLHDEHLVGVYEHIERPLVPILAAMEAAGIGVNSSFLQELSARWQARLSALEEEIYNLAGLSFNIASPQQVGEVLFQNLGLPSGKKGKSGTYSTSSDILEQLALQGHLLPEKILAWRQLAKLKTTYTDALLKQINPQTGRIHTTYGMTHTATGRLSSMQPNLQNIPIRTQEGRHIRQAFVAAPGQVLLSLDYSQIELRLLAHMGQVGTLQAAFQDGQDIHEQTASEVFNVPRQSVSSTLRRQAKIINFGLIYGISSFGLAQQLGISPSQAEHYMKSYFARYPGIQDYLEDAKKKARLQGFVTTCFGRRCYIPHIQDKNPHKRAGAERQAINAPLQGSSADITKLAMIRLNALCREHALPTTLLLQVHDELVFEVPKGEGEGLGPLFQKEMTRVASLSVPLVVDYKIGRNWGLFPS